MSKYFSTAATLVVTFLVSLVLNALGSYFSSDNGSISISSPLSISGKNITVVSIENDSSHFIDGLVLKIPFGVSAAGISSDSAVQISETEPASIQRAGLIKINQIAPRHTTTLAVADTINSGSDSIRILNALESGLTLLKDDQLDSLLGKSLKIALAASIIQALLVSAGTYYSIERLNELRNDLEKVRKDLDERRQESRDIRASTTKIKILLLGKISDYSRELAFWRNFIKETLGRESLRNKDAEKIFDLVKKSLKTYGATDTLPDLDMITIAAGWLRDDERKIDL
jgi:hypothetical protein